MCAVSFQTWCATVIGQRCAGLTSKISCPPAAFEVADLFQDRPIRLAFDHGGGDIGADGDDADDVIDGDDENRSISRASQPRAIKPIKVSASSRTFLVVANF